MILPFKPQFVKSILSGTKKHTIRTDKFNRWCSGRKIEMATGVRTKHYHQFGSGICMAVQKIDIWWTALGVPFVYVDARLLNSFETKQLALNDGFYSETDFFSWFEPLRSDDKIYTGKLIHWTELKY